MSASDHPPQGKRSRSIFSPNAKIIQSVLIGSVFEALATKFFTHRELLNWLHTSQINDRTKIAYKAVCIEIAPDEQYMDNGEHFLVTKPEYAPIAIGYGLDIEIPDHKGGGEPIIVHICDVINHFNAHSRIESPSIGLILTGNVSDSYLRSRLNICYLARNFPHMRLHSNEINKSLVCADWTEKFRYNENLVNIILGRIAFLQREAPLYYAGVAYQAYHKVIIKLHQEKLLCALSREQLYNLNTYFSNIIDSRILTYNDIGYKIALLGNDIAGYVLGFPVQNVVPSDEQIHAAIAMLMELGIEKYTAHIRQYVKSTYMPTYPIPINTPTFSNEQDVLMEDVDSYLPFDIISYQTGDHIHRFTRAEFKQLDESKKNPWTNEWLPSMVLSTIKARVIAAKELGLPDAIPMIELLEKLSKNEVFTISNARAISPLRSTDHSENRTILSSLVSAFLRGESGNAPESQETAPIARSSIIHSNVDMSTIFRVVPTTLTTAQSAIFRGAMNGPIENTSSGEEENINNESSVSDEDILNSLLILRRAVSGTIGYSSDDESNDDSIEEVD